MSSSGRRSRLWILVCAALALFTLTAGAQAKVSISYWNLFSGGDGEVMTAMVELYNSSQDRVHVETTTISWHDYYDKFITALAGGSPPEVAVVHASRMYPFAQGNFMLELTPQVQKRINIQSSDFFPVPWRAGQWQGRQYAIPLDIHPYAFYYNVEHLAYAGFPETPPADGETLISMAKRLTIDTNGDGTIDQWGFRPDAAARGWYGALIQFGGSILSQDGKDVGFLDGSGLKALEFYMRAAEAVGGRFTGSFAEGKVSLFQNGPWVINRLTNLGIPFKTAPMPQIGPTRNAAWADSHMLFIPAPVAEGNPERLEAAFDFIRWLINNTYLWSKGAGHVPTMRSVVTQTDFLRLEHQRAFVQSVDFAYYYPTISRSTELEPAITSNLSPAWNLRGSSQEAIEKLAQQVRILIQEDVARLSSN